MLKINHLILFTILSLFIFSVEGLPTPRSSGNYSVSKAKFDRGPATPRSSGNYSVSKAKFGKGPATPRSSGTYSPPQARGIRK